MKTNGMQCGTPRKTPDATLDTGAVRVHGGPDARGPVRHDFSTNANAAGPCPAALLAIVRADATRYPDPRHAALRARLANFHAVDVSRVLIAASASEFIQRITAVGQRLAPGPVAIPRPGYGDYATAARAWGRPIRTPDGPGPRATLRWCCDPSSPFGFDAPLPTDAAALAALPTVLDAAYAPLRLAGRSAWTAGDRDRVFQLFSPNKALGLPGIRGAYAIAPSDAAWDVAGWCGALDHAAPSWPLGAHAVELLACWTDAPTQAWLAESLDRLRDWTARLRAGLDAIGLEPSDSVTPFLCARRPARATTAALRDAGLAVRDTASFGLPGLMRLSAQAPAAIDALIHTLERLR